MKLTDLELSIIHWAHDRNLINGSTKDKQLNKLTEEVGEIAMAINKDKPHLLNAEIGDAVVVLTLLAAQNGTTLTDCVNQAWVKIKDRKGMMVNGYFIKEEDLPPPEAR